MAKKKKVKPVTHWDWLHSHKLRNKLEEKHYSGRVLWEYDANHHYQELQLVGVEAEEYHQLMRPIIDEEERKRKLRWLASVKRSKERKAEAVTLHKFVDYKNVLKSGRSRDFGKFRKEWLTKAGTDLIGLLKDKLGRNYKFIGCSDTTFYLKYELMDDQDKVNIMISSDWLVDQGHRVTLDFSEGTYNRPMRNSELIDATPVRNEKSRWQPESGSRGTITINANYGKLTFHNK